MENNNILDEKTIYVLNKNEGIVAVFNKTDKDTLIDPQIEEVQNSEAKLKFQVPASSKKWKETYNPENLYLVENKIFSANFTDSISRERTENDEDIISITAYEIQKLLSREFVKTYNSTTGFEEVDDAGNPVKGGQIYIDEFMVILLSGGNKDLINGDKVITTKYEKGTSGYALEALIYGTGWKIGTCDVEGKFDLETDQLSVYENILKVQEIWGGILVFDSLNKIIHHRDETKYLPYSGYEVKYQKNIQSNEYIGDNKIITMLCPLGEGSLNIKSVNDGSLWLTDFSYTNSILKGIENNPDIFEPDQLKKWGERKLKELCKPRRELKVTTALLKSVKGHQNENISLNYIVDVIDYDFIENKTVQLRVIAYSHYIWSDADAVLEIGDITLESTDIFKKQAEAVNLINNGTLDTSKIIDYYKNGKSLKETLKQIDQVIINTKSELSKADDEIAARVSQTETGIDNLNNEIVYQNKTISELIIDVEGVKSFVSSTVNITKQVDGNKKLILENCLEGELLELQIKGNNTVFNNSETSEVTSYGSIIVEGTNLISSDEEDWQNGFRNYNNGIIETNNKYLTTNKLFEIEQNKSIIVTIENLDYNINSARFYDSTGNYIGDGGSIYFNENKTIFKCSSTPTNTAYVSFNINRKDNSQIYPEEINKIKIMLSYGTDIKEYSTYIKRQHISLYELTENELVVGNLFDTGYSAVFLNDDTSYKSLIYKIEPNTIYDFSIGSSLSYSSIVAATFKSYPTNNSQSTNYSYYGSYQITSGSSDNYLVIFFYDASLNEKTVEEVRKNVTVYMNNGALKRIENTYDEFIVKDNKKYLIRKILNGVILNEPTVIYLGPIVIELQSGTNYIEIPNYEADMSAKYAEKNQYTDQFATNVMVNTLIKQTNQEILLAASKKVSINDLIKTFNSQISIKPDIIVIEGNKIAIKSKYFELTADGKVTIKSTNNSPYIYTNLDIQLAIMHIKKYLTLPNELLNLYKQSSSTLSMTDVNKMINIMNGTSSPTKTISNSVFIDPTKTDETMMVKMNENLKTMIGTYQLFTYMMKCNELVIGSKYALTDSNYSGNGILLDGNTRSAKFINEKGDVGVTIDQGGINTYLLTVENQALIKSPTFGATGYAVHGRASGNYYTVAWKTSKNGNYYAAYVDNSEIPLIMSSSNDNEKILSMKFVGPNILYFVQENFGAYEIYVDQSDTKLKKNIEDTKLKGLDYINKIRHIEFDWNEYYPNQGHVDLGYSANQLKEIREDFVSEVKQPKVSEFDTILQYHTGAILPYVTKSIQELSEENTKLKEKVNNLTQILTEVVQKLNLDIDLSNLSE